MKISFEQLERSLQNKISPCYLVSGDEDLFVGEACKKIRNKAQSLGFSERNIVYVDGPAFDWNSLLAEMQGMSLFAERRLFEIRINNPKLGDKGSKAIQEIVNLKPADTILLFSCGKLTSQQQNSAWFKLFIKEAAVIQIWPANPGQVKHWMAEKFRQRDMRLQPAAAELLFERVEGNLLAAAQEVEKLYLNFGAGDISEAQVYQSVTDNARYSIFDLVDKLLLGDTGRGQHILQHLQDEGEEPILIIWALARELRQLANMHTLLAQGLSPDAACSRLKVWSNRKPLLLKGIRRLSQSQVYKLLQHIARIDRTIKGQRPYAMLWHELSHLCMNISGHPGPLATESIEAEFS